MNAVHASVGEKEAVEVAERAVAAPMTFNSLKQVHVLLHAVGGRAASANGKKMSREVNDILRSKSRSAGAEWLCAQVNGAYFGSIIKRTGGTTRPWPLITNRKLIFDMNEDYALKLFCARTSHVWR